MSFEAHDKAVGDILNKTVFNIPRNQRRYVWGKGNWQELFEDIILSSEEDRENHFLGSIVLKDEGKKDGITYYTLIDGQQRITTITIILMVIIRLFKERKMKNDFLGTIDYIQAKNNKNQLFPIITSEYHQSLKQFIKESVNLEQDGISMKAFVNANTISKKKDKVIGEAYTFFYESIQQIIETSENANDTLLKIRDAVVNMVLVSIVATTEEDSYTIFEILNARGQELEDFELIKNYIMRYIHPIENRDDAKAIWNEMELRLGTSFGRYIGHYARHKYGKVQGDKSSDYRIIYRNTKGTNINDLLNDIKLKSEYYLKFISPEKDGENANCTEYEYQIFKFFKSKRQEQFRPLILSLIHQKEMGNLSDSMYEQAIKYIYNFFVCYTLIGEEKSNKLQDIVYKYAVKFEEEYTDEILKEFAEKLKSKIPDYEWFENSFKNLGWSNHTEMYMSEKNKKRVQITLEIIEKFVSQKNEVDIFTIEHILPDSEDEQNAHIGNLIPLEEHLNRRCANKSFEEKLKIYSESNFRMARNITDRYEGKEFSIEGRTRIMAKMIYNNVLELMQLDFDK